MTRRTPPWSTHRVTAAIACMDGSHLLAPRELNVPCPECTRSMSHTSVHVTTAEPTRWVCADHGEFEVEARVVTLALTVARRPYDTPTPQVVQDQYVLVVELDGPPIEQTASRGVFEEALEAGGLPATVCTYATVGDLVEDVPPDGVNWGPLLRRGTWAGV